MHHLLACSTERAFNLSQSHNAPWEKVGCDIFTSNNRDYLCTVDYYSDYFEVDELHKAKIGAAEIGKVKKRFASHGIPDTFHSDNKPPFNSNEFSAFAAKYEFEQVTSLPEYPQSNDKVENAAKKSKNLMKKAASSNSDSGLPYWTGEILQLKVSRVYPHCECFAGAPEPCCQLQENSRNPS